MASLIISSLLILVLLSVSANTDESDPDCILSLMVPRNTVWRVRVTDLLMINCTVTSEPHCWKNVDVSWCKIDDESKCRSLKNSDHITTELRSIKESEGMSFLIFRKISMQDDGLYRCEIMSPVPTVSHAINVTVTDETHTPLSGEKWFYVIYFSVFVFALILAVPLVLSRGLKKFPKDEVTMTTVTYEEAEKSSV